MPIFVKTPLRISLFGGGTDYSEYFERQGGAVLGGTIDKYIYLICLPMSPVADTRYRLTYSSVETIDSPYEIQHPVIREVLLDEKYNTPFNLAVISDIPGGSGLGSSSSFTVGFVNLIRHLKNIASTKYDLAEAAIRVEKELLAETVGVQDQYHAAFGGFSLYQFAKKSTSITPVQLNTDSRDRLNDSLVMIHTKRYRSASAVLSDQVQATKEGKVDKNLDMMKALTHEAMGVLTNQNSDHMLGELGSMLSETWKLKRSLTSKISDHQLDEVYDHAMSLGAYGGKLAGAGGGGFFVFLAPQHTIKKMKDTFGEDSVVQIKFQDEGSRLNTVL